MLTRYLLFVLILLGTTACTSSVQTDRAYQELGRAQHFFLTEPGYIIGIEKRPMRNGIEDYLPGLEAGKAYQTRFQQLKGDGEFTGQRNKVFKRVTTGQIKVMLATQITKKFPNHEYIYNAYENNLSGDYNYESSVKGLDELFEDLSHQLKSSSDAGQPYSHILVMSMGWNNDQVESVRRFNRILDNLEKAAGNSESFKPVVIVFTWPSAWSTISDSWIRKTAES